MTVVDLFAGAGGLDEGFAKVGFDVVAHVEKEKWMCETLKTWDIFHFLEGQNQLPIYYAYLRGGFDYESIERGRADIYGRFDGLQDLIEAGTICRAFGDPTTDPAATNTNAIIEMVSQAINISRKGNGFILREVKRMFQIIFEKMQ